MNNAPHEPQPSQTLSRDAEIRAALTANIVSAYAAHNSIQPSDLVGLIASVASTLAQLAEPAFQAPIKPAVPIRKSVHDGYIVCLEDGVRLKMLRRYLQRQYGLSPDAYRSKWGLPHDYPMVAPAYARVRSAYAKRIGLGTKPTTRRAKS